MKKFIFLFLVSLIFVALPGALLGQSTGEPPENPISMEMFASLTALAAAIVGITALVKNTFNTNGLITDIVSWVVGPIIAMIGWYFNFGMFADIIWYMAILYGLVAALYANKGWDLFSVIRGKKTMDYKKAS